MGNFSFASMFGITDEKDQERWDKQREVERKKKVNPLSEAGVAASSALLRAGRMEVFTEFQAGKNTAYDAQQRAVEKETAQLTASEDVRVKRRNAPSLAEEMGIEQSPASRMKAIER